MSRKCSATLGLRLEHLRKRASDHLNRARHQTHDEAFYSAQAYRLASEALEDGRNGRCSTARKTAIKASGFLRKAKKEHRR